MSSPFGRIFDRLPPWEPAAQGVSSSDAIFALADRAYGDSPDNTRIPAAYTYFGQFVAHDVTFGTPLDASLRRGVAAGQRIPAADLESIYGRGPLIQPYLYELANPARFWIPRNEFGELDLPRNDDASVVHPSAGGDFARRRSAVIGDRRNDENVMIAQLHLALLRFHNARVDEGCDFEEARRLTTWHYQWVLVHDFLRRLCGDEICEKVARGHAVLRSSPLLPAEFSVAVFRFGHSMVSPAYHLNDELDRRLRDAPIPIFETTGPEWRDRDRGAANSLEGERTLPKDWTIQWDRFLALGSGRTRWSRRIDRTLALPLRSLPFRAQSPVHEESEARHRSLAYLTLREGYHARLPSGQAMARELGLAIAGDASDSDPLWLYVLKEAELLEDGHRLGPLGATIAGDVLLGLLRRDETSFVHRRPDWTPTLRARNPAAGFDLADLLIHARAPITAADWMQQKRAT